ncbi:MAG: DNA primase catalytic subunit PriS [Candidatus Micrarchaeota archaeon]|nr:DNA primase catalytic subunit PriS [Candidatus Micrarchaeota archaeon]
MGLREKEFLKAEFSSYYKKHEPDYPHMIEQREFGFGFEKKIDFRHKRFSTHKELWDYLITNAPLFCSYSVAYYTAPEAKPMDAKIMVNSDLVFDIDVHGCTSHTNKFVCESCLGKAKSDTIHLIEDFLVPDFGIDKKQISVNFSGNRGYHIHVNDERYMGLGQKERLEIVNFLNGIGIDAGIFCEHGPRVESPAWFGRIAKCISKKLESGAIKTTKRHEYLEGISKGMWSGICESTWFYREFEECRKSLAANVDAQVTTDVHRLIRLPGTIHGETGLVAKKVANLERFEPLRDAVFADDSEVEVEITGHVPPLAIGGMQFDEINNKKARLPKYYAVYLIAKNAARLV